ncbi:MAG TPA: hypothetical protein PKA37_03260 [Planctomycetota bacterium]|nr:hypothetical protein [Planctomycetota bacterium]
MGGYPWVRRILETLLPFRPTALAVAGGAGAPALRGILTDSGTFGLPLISHEDYLSKPLEPMEHLLVYEFSGPTLRLSDAQRRDFTSKAQKGPSLADGGATSMLLLPTEWNPASTSCLEFLSASSEEWRQGVGHSHIVHFESRTTCGSAFDLRNATQQFLDGGCSAQLLNGRVVGGALVSPGAQIHRNAIVSGPVAVGPMSFVGPGVRLLPGAVVGAHCFVGEGAVLRDAVVLDGTRIEPGSCLEAAVRSGTQVFLGGSPRRSSGASRESRVDSATSLPHGEKERTR